MKSHEKRLELFNEIFKQCPWFERRVLPVDMVDAKVLDKMIKEYAGDIDGDSILGIYNPRGIKKSKYGLIFTDFKIYCNFKKARNRKIWYDEITGIKKRVIKRKELIVFLDDGSKAVIRTTRSMRDAFIEFATRIQTLNDELVEDVRVAENDTINEKQFDSSNIVADMSGVDIGRRKIMEHGFDEEKFHAQQGHGFAAEQANNMFDRIQGKNAKVLNETKKNGADRIITFKNGNVQWIQTKYCKTAEESVNHCFDRNGFRYFDGTGNPMSIEVPADQYEQAVKQMEDKIRNGFFKNPKEPSKSITDPAKAKEIVRKGHITYKQAVNIAKAGTIESITYDAVNGIVVSASAFGISSVVSMAMSIWNGDEFDVAINKAVTTGFKVGGASFLTSVFASQLSKAGLNSMLVGGTETFVRSLGSKVSSYIVNGFRGSAGSIYGATAMKSAAKLLRTNIITSIVMILVFSIADISYLFRRRITFKQFIKNFFVLALSVVSSVVGGIAGSALGTLVLPGVGSVLGSIIFAIAIGALVGHLSKKLFGLFIKDDAEEMVKIIEEEFKDISSENLLTKNESEKIIDRLTRKMSLPRMRKMVASKDKHAFARDLIIPLVENQVKKRKKIKEPTKETILESLKRLMNESKTNNAIAQA